MQADIQPAIDRHEVVSQMEPLLFGEGSPARARLADLSLELAQRSAALRHALPGGLVAPLAELVRSMNCYYSNLIEGHDTHPVEIEAALKGDYSQNLVKRNLQLEALAHITVQAWIDAGGLPGPAVSQASVREIHRRFCELLPAELLFVENPQTHEKVPVVPGEYRQRDVKVGAHVPVSAPAVPRFLERYENVYGALGNAETILAAAAAHHRFVWIHPFLDGNGRVSRLVSHATLLKVLGTGALWSVARGLARTSANYKAHLASCDSPRRGDLDGRGNLSEQALIEFTRYFLETCLDQVQFMQGLIQPQQLRARIRGWAESETQAGKLQSRSAEILDAILYRGELPRGEVPAVTGTGDRQARRVSSSLIESQAVRSESPYAPLKLAFPAHLAERWLPGLFPAQA